MREALDYHLTDLEKINIYSRTMKHLLRKAEEEIREKCVFQK